MGNILLIDDSFIRLWERRYDSQTHDETEYQKIISIAKEQVSRNGTISKELLLRIYNWEAPRARGRIELDNYCKYEECFRKSLQTPENDKEVEILDNLPGIGIPVASTILHIIYPEIFPIVDFRTVEVLQEAGYLDKFKAYYHFRDNVEGYRLFREAINKIHQQNPKWSLRQIDRALFAYHKINKK